MKWKGKKEVVRILLQTCIKILSLSSEHKLSRTPMRASECKMRHLFYNAQNDIHDEVSS